jgi:hypothetical protein
MGDKIEISQNAKLLKGISKVAQGLKQSCSRVSARLLKALSKVA